MLKQTPIKVAEQKLRDYFESVRQYGTNLEQALTEVRAKTKKNIETKLTSLQQQINTFVKNVTDAYDDADSFIGKKMTGNNSATTKLQTCAKLANDALSDCTHGILMAINFEKAWCPNEDDVKKSRKKCLAILAELGDTVPGINITVGNTICEIRELPDTLLKQFTEDNKCTILTNLNAPAVVDKIVNEIRKENVLN